MAASNSPVIRGRSGTYVVSQCIGKGAYGEVFLVKSKKERKLVRSMLVKVTAMTPCKRLTTNGEVFNQTGSIPLRELR